MPSQKITEIVGRGIAIKGNDIDTDRIIPARFMKEVTFINMGKYAFYDERFDDKGNKKQHPFNDERRQGASILIVNNNFGCGSSREHAPQSLMKWGIRAIIGESFADIFAGNCEMIGVPAIAVSKENVAELMRFAEKNSEKEIKISIKYRKIEFDSKTIGFNMDESMKKSFVEGTWDTTSMMLEAKKDTKKIMLKLPYIKNFE